MRFILFLLLLIASPITSQAQFTGNLLVESDVSLELQPAFPEPEKPVSITVSDIRSGGYGSAIKWYLDGVAIPNANNQRVVQITAGKAGTQQTIEATLTSQNGIVSKVKAVIKPIYVDVIVEPQTHVPDFYQGRSLPSVGSNVNLTALLSDGKKILTNNYIYTWRVNNAVLEGGPIRGRNQTSFTAPQDEDVIISLQVSSLDGEIIASRAFTVPAVLPELHFYEINTLYGVSHKAIISEYNLIGNSTTLVAEPYYLDSRIFNYPDISVWNIGREEVSQNNANNPYEITLERTGKSGSLSVGFHVRSTDILLQGARDSIKINF